MIIDERIKHGLVKSIKLSYKPLWDMKVAIGISYDSNILRLCQRAVIRTP